MSNPHPRWRRNPFVRRLRSLAVHWTLVGLCTLVVAWRVTAALDAADDARSVWGATERVAVAAVDLAPGDPLADDSVRWLDVPLAVAPPGRLTAVPDGAVVRSRVAAGEILVDHRIAGTGSGLPLGTAAVEVVLATAPARLAAGDLVDVVATFPVAPGAAPAAEVVASDATVLAIVDRTVSVAVDRADLTAVAHAAATGVVTIAVVG